MRRVSGRGGSGRSDFAVWARSAPEAGLTAAGDGAAAAAGNAGLGRLRRLESTGRPEALAVRNGANGDPGGCPGFASPRREQSARPSRVAVTCERGSGRRRVPGCRRGQDTSEPSRKLVPRR